MESTIKAGDYAEVKQEFDMFGFYKGAHEVLKVDYISEDIKYAFLCGVGVVDVKKLKKVESPFENEKKE